MTSPHARRDRVGCRATRQLGRLPVILTFWLPFGRYPSSPTHRRERNQEACRIWVLAASWCCRWCPSLCLWRLLAARASLEYSVTYVTEQTSLVRIGSPSCAPPAQAAPARRTGALRRHSIRSAQLLHRVGNTQATMDPRSTSTERQHYEPEAPCQWDVTRSLGTRTSFVLAASIARRKLTRDTRRAHA
jgi:hypothetical protein